MFILCNRTRVEDLGIPKSSIIDGPREGDKVQGKKSPFCKQELCPQALCLPQLMALTIVTQIYASILWPCSTKKESRTRDM